MTATNNVSNVIVFNCSKKELFTPNNGFKTWCRKLKANWKIVMNKDEVTKEKLAVARILILAAPKEKFKNSEFDAIRHFLDNGGSVFIMMSDGGESTFPTNVNFLIEEFGIMVNNDSVVRINFYKYFHPKEALVPNGILNREINRAGGKKVPGGKDSLSDTDVVSSTQSLTFLYPYGASLTVDKRSHPVLSSGSVCFPVNRPICAFHSSKHSKGKLVVLGSVHMFNDQYIDKEENNKLQDILLRWLTTDEITLNSIDAEEPELSDYQQVPDTPLLSDRLRVCLQEGEDVPRDFTQVFHEKLYNLDTSLLPTVLRAFGEMGVKHEQLSLITPQFECPLPPLQPTVFPPKFRDLPPPALDLYDLDESFSSERARMAQITNKCTEEDVEYYVRECGDILGVASKLPPDSRDARHILEHIFAQVVEFKKLNQERELEEDDVDNSNMGPDLWNTE